LPRPSASVAGPGLADHEGRQIGRSEQIAAVLLLTAYAWSASRAAQLRLRDLLIVTSIAAALGLVMIAVLDVTTRLTA
jgi:hypothetical protein